MQITVTRPAFLTANVYFWSPGSSASQRQQNENKRHKEFADWLIERGFICERKGDTTYAVHPDGRTADLYYRESAAHVYRKCEVYNTNGKKSNITILK